jgi:hypothetical protein
MIVEIAVAAAVIATVVAIKKHGSVAAAEASAKKEVAIIKADISAAVTKAEATISTVKADLAKYL